MRLIAFLALLVNVLAAVGDAGMVCFGADGHVALERLRDEHPRINDSTAISVAHGDAVFLVARAWPRAMPHGPCFDVALDPGSQWHARARAETPRVVAPPQAPAVVAPLVLAPPVDAPHHRVASAESSTDRVLTPLRSTVLRI